MTQARAALLHAPDEPLSIEDVEINQIEADEIVVRVAGVGVCHTDISGHSGVVPLPYPSVLGHEGSGTVIEVGVDVIDIAVGDRVVVSFASCGECTYCLSGHPAYCELFAALNYFGCRLDGSTTLRQGDEEVHGSFFGQSSFATHVVTAARNAVRVGDDVPLEIAGPLGCGIQTGAGTVFNVLHLQPASTLAVFGLGTVGLSAVMAAAAVGCRIILAVDVNPERLALALSLGATHVIDASASDDVVWSALEVEPVGFDASIDAVGFGSVVRQAVEVLRSPGTCATLGLQGLENDITINQGHLLIGRTLTGVIEGDANPRVLIPQLLDLWREGRFPFERLVQRFAFDDIEAAMAAARSGAAIKPVLVFE